jgi:hypothetical protein
MDEVVVEAKPRLIPVKRIEDVHPIGEHERQGAYKDPARSHQPLPPEYLSWVLLTDSVTRAERGFAVTESVEQIQALIDGEG